MREHCGSEGKEAERECMDATLRRALLRPAGPRAYCSHIFSVPLQAIAPAAPRSIRSFPITAMMQPASSSRLVNLNRDITDF